MNTKKILATLLAMLMALTMATTALAANDGTITISNAMPGETYSIYRIFDLESYNADGAYAYKTNTTWSTFVNQATINGVYVDVDAQGYVTWVENADPAAFAQLAIAYATTNSIANNGTATAPAAAAPATTSTVSFANLPYGYYLVDTTVGTLCSLTTTDPNAAVEEKNANPTVDKQVEEDSTGTYGDTNQADIGQTVNFKTTIHAKKGASNYVLHDKLSTGLTFGSVTGIAAGGTTLTAGTHYTVTTAGLTDGCTFEVSFTQAYLDTITADTDIVVSYTAELNSSAVIGGEGNDNETQLTYGAESETTWDETTTYTYEFNIFKHTTTVEGEATVDSPLAGAEFRLYKTVNGTNHYAQITNGKLTGWTTDATLATTLTSPADGIIQIEGLDAGEYSLEETKAPDGYNTMTPNPMTVTISDTGTVTGATNVTVTPDEGASVTYPNTIKVLNQSGTELPSTGGIGVTIFYVLGGILMVGAVILFVAKRRTREGKN